MPSGLLGNQVLTAGADTVVYTVPPSKYSVCTLVLCNRNIALPAISASQSGTTATITSSVSWNFVSGNIVTISGIGFPWDGTYAITVTNSFTFTYTVATSNVVGTFATSGTISPISKIKIAIAASITPVNAEYIEYDSNLEVSSQIERTGLVLDAGKRVIINSSMNNVTAVCHGIEATIA